MLFDRGMAQFTIMIMNVLFIIVAAARIFPSGIPMLGQNDYTLSCRVYVNNNFCSPSITYRWIKTNDINTTIQLETKSSVLSFYSNSLRLSDAGLYTCYATISSLFLNSDITVTASHKVKIQSELN